LFGGAGWLPRRGDGACTGPLWAQLPPPSVALLPARAASPSGCHSHASLPRARLH